MRAKLEQKARVTDGDPAKRRFLTIQLARLCGTAFVLVGILALYGRLAMPRAVAIALVLLGLALALIVPSVLARRWRSPRR